MCGEGERNRGINFWNILKKRKRYLVDGLKEKVYSAQLAIKSYWEQKNIGMFFSDLLSMD